ncbi:MAG: ABC transporter substrate-binding protein, partial [Rhodobacteraceae bacterium]|nr:ABC transporter substrate-binding protein [Paracoccaceae bacterium]
LAMLLAAPGQLVAVTYLARDPRSSTMPDAAMAYDITWGGAEEVFLKRPDLVLAGTYTTRATVEMLRRLGVPVAAFEAGLAALRQDIARRPRAALYYANGWTGGRRSLAGEILAAAGFENVAEEGGVLPLERLLIEAPDVVITGAPYPAASRAEEVMDHPALAGLRREGAITDAEWVCGLPGVLSAIARLGALREALP